jgi:predicted SAM-dependent methyltransferase
MSLRVNVGCGSSPTAGWVNIDNSPSVALSRLPDALLKALARLGLLSPERLQVVHAARQFAIRRASATNLPFRSGSVDMVYSSHMLEHLDREQAREFLAEAHRVLRPGGWIRIVVPDLERYVREYQEDGNADALIENLRLAMSKERGRERLIQQIVGFRGHRWMYDSISLTKLLASCGFRDAAVIDPGETKIPDLGDLDLRERSDDSIYCEARKPLDATELAHRGGT